MSNFSPVRKEKVVPKTLVLNNYEFEKMCDKVTKRVINNQDKEIKMSKKIFNLTPI
jgi:hypothetical protein